VPANASDATIQLVELSGVFMIATFVIFAAYGLFASAMREHVISRPRVVAWMRRTFAATYVLLAGKLAFTTN
jgi:threonine/homoserine/homoserine lactone efflux protein